MAIDYLPLSLVMSAKMCKILEMSYFVTGYCLSQENLYFQKRYLR